MTLSIAKELSINEQQILFLNEGIVYINEAIHLTSNTLICGAIRSGKVLTIIKRGKNNDGSLYEGPLIVVADIANSGLKNLIIDGGRFEEIDTRIFDHRHPINATRDNCWFSLIRIPENLTNHDHDDYSPPVEADVICSGSSNLSVENVEFIDAIKIGLGLGTKCNQVTINSCTFNRSGDIGLWIGCNLGLSTLPLNDEQKQQQPSNIHIENCTFSKTGASATHIDGRSVSFFDCNFSGNHCDFPYNESGGQVAIDYKSSNILIKSCAIKNGPWLARNTSLIDIKNTPTLLGSCGIELAGENIQLIDNEISGNATEAIHINGARQLWITGSNTNIHNNQQLIKAKNLAGAVEDIAITASMHFVELNSKTHGIYINGINIEHGVIIWSDQTITDLRLDQLVICNNSSTKQKTLTVKIQKNKNGKSLLGENCMV